MSVFPPVGTRLLGSIVLISLFASGAASGQPEPPTLIVLGTVQDAGSPHIACRKDCCAPLFENPDPGRKVVSLGLFDPSHGRRYLLEATPDITTQLRALKEYSGREGQEVPDGIFLTHAHIGHYTGLMYLGKEGLGASGVKVYAMPMMNAYLKDNGPWSQLIRDQNISLQPLQDRTEVSLTPNLSVVPFRVPHRDEYSETVGYQIIGPTKTALFIPDINKWSQWDSNIVDEIKKVDYAFIDATFYNEADVSHRDISEIPHPFVIESVALFSGLSREEKQKIWFIHLNHTNPLLDPESEKSKLVQSQGFNIARFQNVFEL